MAHLLAKKVGMTQTFDENGKFIPITILEVETCVVLGKNKNNLIVGYQDIKEEKLKKPQSGFFKKLGIPCKKIIKEFPIEQGKDYKPTDVLRVDSFEVGEFIDITGTSIGKGFQGGVKRWGWRGGGDGHGSTSHRRVGSIGASSDPSRVFKGHHMPGHMGACKVTIQNLKIIKIETQDNLIAVKGAVPGHKNGIVIISSAIKKQKKISLKKVVGQSSNETTKKGK